MVRNAEPKIAIVGQDGVPYREVHHPIFENGTTLLSAFALPPMFWPAKA